MTKIEYSVVSSTGKVRENNEDNFFADGKTLSNFDCEPIVIDFATDRGIFAVCDGMGGEDCGEVASEIAVHTLAKYGEYIFNNKNLDKPYHVYVNDANTRICDEIKKREANRIGTTLALLAIADLYAEICNIGDSRVYLFRNEILKQISKDHTQAQRMVDFGILTAEKAKTHSGRNKLTQHLGIFPNEMVIEPYVSEKILLKDGDIFLLCSDGLTDMVEDESIAQSLIAIKNTKQITANLMNAALENGGKDNITIIVIRICV